MKIRYVDRLQIDQGSQKISPKDVLSSFCIFLLFFGQNLDNCVLLWYFTEYFVQNLSENISQMSE
jgi:hypothetical protein